MIGRRKHNKRQRMPGGAVEQVVSYGFCNEVMFEQGPGEVE